MFHPETFPLEILLQLREDIDICYDRIKDILCITCPSKPEESMFVKLHLNLIEDIKDDLEFCFKLAKEESLMILPGKRKQTLRKLIKLSKILARFSYSNKCLFRGGLSFKILLFF
ncbi:hypothetical protein T459_16641 [Capsicum annuum]|uniref:Uncharacterized protein n=1 Tax=Capsicum annuum TaxID=4072 RepID=A0A2G2Z9E6_CAPAN|nr:hypothetical protein T459_16641 [Capsicum annuum]